MTHFYFFLITISLMLTSQAYANSQVFRTCKVTLPSELGQSDDAQDYSMKFELILKDSEVVSRITIKEGTIDAPVQVSALNIREDLPNSIDAADTLDLNEGEKIILHARSVSESKEVGHLFQTGVDLKKIRSVVLYLVGERADMGSSTIVVARDKNGVELGSFLGGFLVSACQ